MCGYDFTKLQDLRMSGRYKLRMKISKWTHIFSCTWTLLDGVTMTVDDSWHWRVANSLTKSYSRNLVPCDLCRITSVNTTSILVVWLRKSWILWLEGVWCDLELTNPFVVMSRYTQWLSNWFVTYTCLCSSNLMVLYWQRGYL